MHYPIEEILPYKGLAVLILALFYGIYFVKLLLQKRQGIRTNQIGSRKEKGLHTVELLMSAATAGIVVVQLVSIVLERNWMPANARFTGFLLALLGDMIFLISVMTMRDSWRAGIPSQDKTSLVTVGIYKFSRNPAFLGFDLMYLGMLFMYFNSVMLLFTIYAIVMLHLQILQEEKYLERTFGEEYSVYKKQVFRYLGRKFEK